MRPLLRLALPAAGAAALAACSSEIAMGTPPGGGGSTISASTTGMPATGGAPTTSSSTISTGGAGGGTGACAPGLTLCGGACVDTTSDAHACGACGHDCLDTPCVASMCAPVPVATGPSDSLALAIDATDVYWTAKQSGTLSRAPIAGGPVTVLATGQGHPSGVALDAATVYWTSVSTGTIQAMPKQGGSATELAGSAEWPNTIAVDATHVYWTENQHVMRVPLAGGPSEMMGSGISEWEVRLDADRVYWDDEGDLRSISKDLAEFHTLTTMGAVEDLAVGDTYLYLSTSGLIGRLPKDGSAYGAVEPVIGGVSVCRIALDAKHVYWTDCGGGTVSRAPLDGGAVEIVASGQDKPTALVVNDTFVVWGNEGDGRIMKAVK